MAEIAGDDRKRIDAFEDECLIWFLVLRNKRDLLLTTQGMRVYNFVKEVLKNSRHAKPHKYSKEFLQKYFSSGFGQVAIEDIVEYEESLLDLVKREWTFKHEKQNHRTDPDGAA